MRNTHKVKREEGGTYIASQISQINQLVNQRVIDVAARLLSSINF